MSVSTLHVSLDTRGFLRFPSQTAAIIKIAQYSFVHVYIEPHLQTLALSFAHKERQGSFRILNHHGRYLVYLKGALKQAGISFCSGNASLIRFSRNKWIFSQQEILPKLHNPQWIFFPCRMSPTIPMISIDNRGTLILDRHCTQAIDMHQLSTTNADYHNQQKKMVLSFHRDSGMLNVRCIGSHANISFMGTLSSFGIALPPKTMKIPCDIQNQTISFTLENLLKTTLQ